jgi:hypothetical protein
MSTEVRASILHWLFILEKVSIIWLQVRTHISFALSRVNDVGCVTWRDSAQVLYKPSE